MSSPCLGAEFLRRRLQRASAIPPHERPPDVAAFVESVQLLREACDLLPLTRDGRPALPVSSPAARRQVLIAFLKTAGADYLCPAAPVCDQPDAQHTNTYFSAVLQTLVSARLAPQHAASGGRGSGSTQRHARLVRDSGAAAAAAAAPPALEELVALWAATKHVSDEQVAAQAGIAAADMLADATTRQALARQLEQLAGGQAEQSLLSLDQLRYACCYNVTQVWTRALPPAEGQTEPGVRQVVAFMGLASDQQALTAEQFAGVQAAGSRCWAACLELQPHNPKTLHAAAGAPNTSFSQGAELFLRAAQLGQQQGGFFHTAYCMPMALLGVASSLRSASLGADSSRQLSTATLRGILDALPAAEPALQRCKRLLPAACVQGVDNWATGLQAAQQIAVILGRRLGVQAEVARHATSTAAAAVSLRHALHASIVDQLQMVGCDGCSQQAVGLRRCARCKQAQYCSVECQRQHWRVHKRDCQPAD